jgi:Uma2 family endonuclease
MKMSGYANPNYYWNGSIGNKTMSDLIELEDEVLKEDEVLEEEEQDMPSVNHSTVQAQITGLLFNDGRFRVMVELSLDASQIDLSQFGLKMKDEIIPDVCLYLKGKRYTERGDDLLRMPEMPLLAIEILSPSQSVSSLIAKIKAYFALGIQSCWLVIPATETVTVYSKPNEFISFGAKDTEAFDEVMDIRLPIQNIFE